MLTETRWASIDTNLWCRHLCVDRGLFQLVSKFLQIIFRKVSIDTRRVSIKTFSSVDSWQSICQFMVDFLLKKIRRFVILMGCWSIPLVNVDGHWTRDWKVTFVQLIWFSKSVLYFLFYQNNIDKVFLIDIRLLTENSTLRFHSLSSLCNLSV